MTVRLRDSAAAWLVTLNIVAVVGCTTRPSPPPTSAIVIGTATLDGAPITGGMITIALDDDLRRRATGVLRGDGTFRLESAPIGRCRVAIDTTSIELGDPTSYMPLPPKYEGLDTTDLEVELQAGENQDLLLKCTR